MRGNTYHASQASEAITAALTTGSTSIEGAQVSDEGTGPESAVTAKHKHPPRQDGGWFAQWKKLLGFDTFIATASTGGGTKLRRNPFSRGVLTNCKDFWSDPAPIFGRRENGSAMLDGAVVNYTRMYESPPRMKMRRPREDGGGGMYHSVDNDDIV